MAVTSLAIVAQEPHTRSVNILKNYADAPIVIDALTADGRGIESKVPFQAVDTWAENLQLVLSNKTAKDIVSFRVILVCTNADDFKAGDHLGVQMLFGRRPARSVPVDRRLTLENVTQIKFPAGTTKHFEVTAYRAEIRKQAAATGPNGFKSCQISITNVDFQDESRWAFGNYQIPRTGSDVDYLTVPRAEFIEFGKKQ